MLKLHYETFQNFVTYENKLFFRRSKNDTMDGSKMLVKIEKKERLLFRGKTNHHLKTWQSLLPCILLNSLHAGSFKYVKYNQEQF